MLFSTQTTLDRYSHILLNTQNEAVKLLKTLDFKIRFANG